MNKLFVVGSTLFALLTVAGCAADAPPAGDDGAATDDGAANEMVSGTSGRPPARPLDDIDGDGEEESLSPRGCGTGGCTYDITLSASGPAGSFFAKGIDVLESTSEADVHDLLVSTSSGPCITNFEKYNYRGGKFYKAAELVCKDYWETGESPSEVLAAGCDGLPEQCKSL